MDKSCSHNSRGQEDIVALKGIRALRGTVFPLLYTLGGKGVLPQKSELPLSLTGAKEAKKCTKNCSNALKCTTGLTVNEV